MRVMLSELAFSVTLTKRHIMYTVLYVLLVSWLVWTINNNKKVAVTKDNPIITLCMLTYNAQGYKKIGFQTGNC